MILQVAILALLVGLIVMAVGAPLRRARVSPGSQQPSSAPDTRPAAEVHAREELEVAREAKYREIRDAELDYRTGKLSNEDYQAIDAELRAQAIEILNRLERANASDADAAKSGGGGDAATPESAPPD